MVGYLLRCRGRATLLDSVGGEGLAETGRGSIGEELGEVVERVHLCCFSREGLDTGEEIKEIFLEFDRLFVVCFKQSV